MLASGAGQKDFPLTDPLDVAWDRGPLDPACPPILVDEYRIDHSHLAVGTPEVGSDAKRLDRCHAAREALKCASLGSREHEVQDRNGLVVAHEDVVLIEITTHRRSIDTPGDRCHFTGVA